MKLDIDSANAAKEELLNKHGMLLEAATIVLGDKGFRIEAVVKAGVRMRNPVAEIQGIPVVWV